MDTTEQWLRHKRFANISEYVKNPFTSLDAIRFLCGSYVGSGAYRDVYDFDIIPNSVIKINTTGHNPNMIEYEVWESVKKEPYAKWFAPCLFISPDGSFLVQRKCRQIREADKLPKSIPGFLTDVKEENFGMIGNQLVCFDYQFLSRAISIGMHTSPRKIKFKDGVLSTID